MNALWDVDWRAWVENFRFAHPEALALLLLLPVHAWFAGRQTRRPAAAIAGLSQIHGLETASSGHRRGLRISGYLIPLACLAIALAQPQFRHGEVEEIRESMDLVLALDVSGSMLDPFTRTVEGTRSRADSLKEIVHAFIDQREEDRIGVIGFAGETYLVSPLTFDHEFVKEIIELTRFDRKGTAIGEGLLAALSRFDDAEDRTKAMVLVTDGDNTTGVSPFEAADLVRGSGIRTYAIEITSDAVSSGDTGQRELARVMERAGGRYFHASDAASLSRIYSEIDALERTEITQSRATPYRELFPWVLGFGLIALLGQILIQRTLLLRIP